MVHLHGLNQIWPNPWPKHYFCIWFDFTWFFSVVFQRHSKYWTIKALILRFNCSLHYKEKDDKRFETLCLEKKIWLWNTWNYIYIASMQWNICVTWTSRLSSKYTELKCSLWWIICPQQVFHVALEWTKTKAFWEVKKKNHSESMGHAWTNHQWTRSLKKNNHRWFTEYWSAQWNQKSIVYHICIIVMYQIIVLKMYQKHMDALSIYLCSYYWIVKLICFKSKYPSYIQTAGFFHHLIYYEWRSHSLPIFNYSRSH